MQNYFTSIEVEGDNSVVGVLYEKSSNKQLYKTQKYPSQSQAIRDINNYISSQQSVTEQTTTLNTIKMHPVPGQIPRRCCGR
jgi:hypothetical protein